MESTDPKLEQETTVETGNNEKTFTQAEVDRILGERLARERKNMPDPEQLKAFEEWKKERQSEAEKAAETAKKLQEAQSEAEQLRRENTVIRAGVNADDADYVFVQGRQDGRGLQR